MRAFNNLIIALAVAGASLATSCSRSGLGSSVRKDISSQVQTANEPIAACYEAALKRDRKLRGRMDVSISAAPKTGAFEKVTIVRNDLSDSELTQCVIDQVSKLKLDKPQRTAVTAVHPLDFAPTK